jgi:uncharacterized small protein (DUF1192 family)
MFDTDQTFADRGSFASTEYQETLALLQEEIERLERELASRTERPWEAAQLDVTSAGNENTPSPAMASDPGAYEEIERLKSELAKRDETVSLLVDQLGLLEESSAANRAEWEQMTEWVTELEKRVEGQDEDALRRLQARLNDQTRETDELRAKSDERSRGWEVQRQVYEATVARLQGELAHSHASRRAAVDDESLHDAELHADAGLVEALREENIQLRARLEVVERTSAETSSSLRARLVELQDERDELVRQLQQFQDVQRREQLEHEASLAELRTKLSQASLAQPDAPRSIPAREAPKKEQETDLRIRALRQHLLEIHQREEQERRQRSLKGRLSRLWSRTSPQ